MIRNHDSSFLSNSVQKQKILMNDERFIGINEKTSHSVSKIMNWLLVLLLFFTSVVMKNYTSLFIVSFIIIIKFALTICYSYYYNKKL